MDEFRFLFLKSLKATNNQTVTKMHTVYTYSIQLNTVSLNCDMNYDFLSLDSCDI